MAVKQSESTKASSAPADLSSSSPDMELTQSVPQLGSYYLQTFGCQMNEYDSELISHMMEQMHYSSVEDPADADVAIFNTCCIRDNADQKVYGRLGGFKAIKKNRPHQVLAVMGCLAQKDGERFLEDFAQVDVVVGTHNLKDLPELVLRVQQGEGRFARVDKVGDSFLLPANPRSDFSGMVTISMGCDQWCTFCIVPYVRGRLKSRPTEQIVSEVYRLAAAGRRDILLLGQNVNDYGRDLPSAEGAKKDDFGVLLDQLRDVPGLDRLRFTSPHPAYFTQSVIDAMAANPSVVEGVHMPVQSGDNQMLERMKRKYTREQYLDLVARMRQAIPNVSLTTDFIVGFPGETEEQFQNTLALVREVRFRSAFMFAYSARPGTPGALFKDHVPEDEKMDRLHRLMDLQNSISWEENQKLVGTEIELLVEGRSRKQPHRLNGRSRCGRLFHFECADELTGHLVRVKVTENFTWGCLATLLEREEKIGDWSRIPLPVTPPVPAKPLLRVLN